MSETPTPGLTPRARKAVDLAIEEARDRGHAAALPGHLMLGLLAEGTGLATGILETLGVDLNALKDAIETTLPSREATGPGLRVEYSSETGGILRDAQDEARRFGHNWLGQEHVLLALLRQGGGVARTLAQFSVTFDAVRAQVLVVLGRAPIGGQAQTLQSGAS